MSFIGPILEAPPFDEQYVPDQPLADTSPITVPPKCCQSNQCGPQQGTATAAKGGGNIACYTAPCQKPPNQPASCVTGSSAPAEAKSTEASGFWAGGSTAKGGAGENPPSGKLNCLWGSCGGGGGSGGDGDWGGCLCCPPDSPTCTPPSSSTSGFSAFPVRYANGELKLVVQDLSSVGLGVPWGHTRTYSNRLTAPYEGLNGNNWFVTELPHLALSDDGNSLCVISSIYDAKWFVKQGSVWTPKFYVQDTLIEDSTHQEFVLIDRAGQETRFTDFSTTLPNYQQGQFKSFTDAYGHDAFAVDTPGRPTYFRISVSNTENCQYAYAYDEYTSRLASVTLSYNDTPVRRCRYEYYRTDGLHGRVGDLKFAILQEYVGNSWVDVDTTYYRYETRLSPDRSLLKFVVGPQSWQALKDHASDNLADEEIAPYADHCFAYNGDDWVTEEQIAGGTKAYQFAYDARTTVQTDLNEWQMRTTETRPDQSTMTVYTNCAGQAILKAFQGLHDAAPQCEYCSYDGDGRLVKKAGPEAIASYEESSYETGRNLTVTFVTTSMVIPVFEYYTLDDVQNSVTGAVAGYLRYEKIQPAWNASGNDVIKLREWQYTAYSPGSNRGTIYAVSDVTVFYCEEGGGTDDATIHFDYDWHLNSFQVLQRTIQWPVVPTEQHGVGTSGPVEQRMEYFDEHGHVTWLKDERGFLTRYQYDLATGGILQIIRDVNTGLITDAPAVPSGWTTPSGAGLHLIMDYELDDRGRVTQELGPLHDIDLDGTSTSLRRARWQVYLDDIHQYREAYGYAIPVGSSGSNYAFTLINPVTLRWYDNAGRLTDEIQAVRSGTSGRLTANDVFLQTSWTAWSHTDYDIGSNPSRIRVYHDIPESGPGGNETNYAETLLAYATMMQSNRIVTPGGTITRTVYDSRGRPVETWVGTDDRDATEEYPDGRTSPDGEPATGNNLVLVEDHAYAIDSVTGTQVITIGRHPNDAETRETVLNFDWRNRLSTLTEAGTFKETYTYCNLGGLTVTKRENITTETPTLLWLRKQMLDSRGRVYQTRRYSALGEAGNCLVDDTWYDPAGNLIKQQKAGGQAFEKMTYDSLNRLIRRYLAFDPTPTDGNNPASVEEDIVVQQNEMVYDAAGNKIFERLRERFHNAGTTPGELGGPTG